jgi:hypothetical protein
MHAGGWPEGTASLVESKANRLANQLSHFEVELYAGGQIKLSSTREPHEEM